MQIYGDSTNREASGISGHGNGVDCTGGRIILIRDEEDSHRDFLIVEAVPHLNPLLSFSYPARRFFGETLSN